jgi:hypothetical protein
MKKKIYFTLFTDIIVLSKVPKKGLLSVKEKEEGDQVHTFVEGGSAKLVAANDNGEISFSVNGDTYVIMIDDKDLYVKFASTLKK